MAHAGQSPCVIAFGGSSAPLPASALIPSTSLHQSHVSDSASSTPGSGGPCGSPLPAPSSPFVWDTDGAHSEPLVSPVQLSGKKKGGLLSGLKKIFHHPKCDGRAATGEGEGRAASEGPVPSTDSAGFLEPSCSKADRREKAPPGLKVQVGSGRSDHTLASILTSPVRTPAAPCSPGILNSPMPSMRLEHAPSSTLSSQESDAVNGSSCEQRLFPNFVRSGPSGRIVQNQSGPLASSLSSHLPATVRACASVRPQSPVRKSLTTALAIGSGSLGNCNLGPLLRGVSADTVTDECQQQQQQLRGGNGGSGRVALPYLSSPRNLEQPVASPGRAYGSCLAPNAEVVDDTNEEEEEAEEEPGTVLLGMNPAVPVGMRRRIWRLGDYQVVKRMYKGATSAVYRAVCLRSGITVALKVYFLSRVPINVVHMIRREIELHVPLVHRNIVMLYGAFQDEKHIVLVEEFAARGDLFGIHRSMNCRLTETQTSELILAPFLDALAYLHARGVMHRDIKPENILFTQDWVLKVADFGVSINVHDERAVTRTGTADYMAPEVERCPLKHKPEDNKDNPSLAYTTAIDIWSVGVLAYEMLVGFPPFVSNGSGAPGGDEATRPLPGVAAFMAEQATRKTLRFPASVSANAKDFIMAALNENPGDRPTARELLKHPWLFKMARRTSTNSTSRFSNPNLVLGPH